jgi:hypothetical protein
MGDAGWLGFEVSGIDTVGDGLTCWLVNLVEFLEVMVGAELLVLTKWCRFLGFGWTFG